MARFRFRLERVLDHRHQRKETLAGELTAALAAQHAAERTLEQALAAEQQLAHQLTERQAEAVLDCGLLGQTLSFLDDAARVSGQARVRFAQAQEQVAQRRADLAAASRDEQILIRLADQRRGQFEAEERRRDQRSHDEMATIGHYRHQRRN